MSNFFDSSDRRDDDLAPGPMDLHGWRSQHVENPFDDPKVRQRMAELIVRSAMKADRFGT
jgi:hypothetical protein